MTDKGIKRHLQYKIEDWLEHLAETDPELALKVRKDIIVTGGAPVSLIQREKPNDYDVYLKTRKSAEALGRFYCTWYNEKIRKEGDPKALIKIDTPEDSRVPITKDRVKIHIQSDGAASENDNLLEHTFENHLDAVSQTDDVAVEDVIKATEDKEGNKPRYRPVFLSQNAITLSDGIQIVLRFYGTPEEIHETYDFLHCKIYYDLDRNKLEYSKEILRSILDKRLQYTGSRYPVCSVIRLRKFIRRGWHVNAGHILKMLVQVSELDLYDVDVLEDQLVGVDSAYFMSLIKAIREKQTKDESFKITEGYITTLIERIFS